MHRQLEWNSNLLNTKDDSGDIMTFFNMPDDFAIAPSCNMIGYPCQHIPEDVIYLIHNVIISNRWRRWSAESIDQLNIELPEPRRDYITRSLIVLSIGTLVIVDGEDRNGFACFRANPEYE